METYFYKARDKKGKLVKGNIDANNQLEAKRSLSSQELMVIELNSSSSNKMESLFLFIKNSLVPQVDLEDLIVFNRQMQTSYSVGVSMVQALNLIADQTENENFKQVIQKIILDVSEGRSLHEALARHPQVFDPIYVNAIRAGEDSGSLEEILELLCYFTEQKLENRNKIKSATLYPKFIIGTVLFVLLTVFYFVIPKIKGFYDKFGGQLPPITLFVMGISDFLVNYWYLVVGLGFGSYVGIKKYLSTPQGRYLWHKVQLKIPVFGMIYLQTDMFTFSTVLHLLMKSGIPIIDALGIVKNSLNNEVIKNEVDVFTASISEGKSISAGFQESKVFPKLVGSLISVSEESGKVDMVLGRIAQYYKIQLEYRLNNLSKAIEPVFLILIFGIILVLVLSIFLPIWKMSQVMKLK